MLSLYFALTLITDRRHPAADQVDQYKSLETVHLRSEDICCKFIFDVNG